jgi:hypothetical protein
MLQYAVPPGYQRQQPIKRPKLGPWLSIIDAILNDDKQRPVKQRHTAKRIFERSNDYSVPTEYGHRQVWVKGYVHEVVIACGSEIIARHQRSYEREAVVFDPLHYLALLEQKTRRWIKQPHWPAGSCRSALRNCDGCWKQGSRSRAAASMYRC